MGHDDAGRHADLKVPPQDRFAWYVAAAESAGVVAAAAGTTTDDRLRRELITAWKAINRAVPTGTSLGVEVAPGDAAQLRLVDADQQVSRRPTVAWPAAAATSTSDAAELSTMLGGASRVLMAARLADAPQHAVVQALLVQAVELAAQIARTIAAQQDATNAQRRAVAATARVAELAAARTRPAGWQFTKTGTEVIDAARGARAAGEDSSIDNARPPTPERNPGPEQGR